MVRNLGGRQDSSFRMHKMLAQVDDVAVLEARGLTRLSRVQPGDRGIIAEVRADHTSGHGVDVHELERRLLEFGFVEGAAFEILHQGLFGSDPIAVKLDDMRVALRRRDATDVWVRLDDQ